MKFTKVKFEVEVKPGTPQAEIDNYYQVLRLVFPIGKLENGNFKPLATAFFIGNSLFATAKHVVQDSYGEPLSDLFGLTGMMSEGECVLRPVSLLVMHNIDDLAVGVLEPHESVPGNTEVLPLTEIIPPTRSKITTIGFPAGSFELLQTSEFVFNFPVHFVSGEIEAHHPTGRDSYILPGHCFQVQMDIPGGCSGGPVADGNGCVFAVNSTGYDNTDLGYITSIKGIFDMSIPTTLQNGFFELVKFTDLRDRGNIIVV